MPNGSGSFLIRAEGDELHFTPESSEQFAAALGIPGDIDPISPQESSTPVASAVGDNPVLADRPEISPPVDEGATVDQESEPHASHHEILDGPEPGSLTVGLFYLLAAATALLGLWAAITLII